MTTKRRPRHWYYRVVWHPGFAVIPFAYFIYRCASVGFNTSRTIGLIITGLGFVFAVLDKLPGHRLSNWVDHEDEAA